MIVAMIILLIELSHRNLRPWNLLKEKKKPQTIPKLQCDKNAEAYNMEHTSKSRCIIFNYENFQSGNLKDRKGSTVDVKSLESTFEKLNFEVVIHQNKTFEDTHEILEKGKHCKFDVTDHNYFCNLQNPK